MTNKAQEIHITILVDNCVYMPGIRAEHGLSMLVQKGSKKVLFDCGQSGLLLENARKLKIALEGIDAIVLSHGHFDHCGGLASVIKQNPGVKILGHPNIFEQKFVNKPKLRYVGMGSKQQYRDAGAEFLLSSESMAIDEGIYTTGQVPRVTDFEYVGKNFIKKVDGGYIQDPILDDLSLIIEHKKGIVLLLGCAHSGIINTLKKASALSGKDAFLLVAGGMHLMHKDDAYVQKVLAEMQGFTIDSVMPLHCSGNNHDGLFKKYFDTRLHKGSAGQYMKV